MYLCINKLNFETRRSFLFVFIQLFFFIFVCAGYTLSSDEIMVIANKKVPKGISLAKYYMNQRDIPEENLIQLWVSDKRWISMDEYENKIEKNIRGQLTKKDPLQRIRCLVIMPGVPLKIYPPKITMAQKKVVNSLKEKRKKKNFI
jgi:uncharacterized protein (TIGR03790 family)